MASRASLNKVLLIGNLTRDPELRYTPSGAAVCTFGLATNRTYTSSDGTKKEETEFMRIVSWNKLAELCSQLLTKGRKVYVEGRMQTRSWETPDGTTRQTTEVVIDDMRILDSRKSFEEELPDVMPEPVVHQVAPQPQPIKSDDEAQPIQSQDQPQAKPSSKSSPKAPKSTPEQNKDKEEKIKDDNQSPGTEGDVNLEDLPF